MPNSAASRSAAWRATRESGLSGGPLTPNRLPVSLERVPVPPSFSVRWVRSMPNSRYMRSFSRTSSAV